MNLVMIGRFKDAGAAEAAKDAIEELKAYFCEKEPDGETYSDEAMELLRRLKFNIAAPEDLDQFRYSFNVEAENETVVITTDESEVSALFKLMIARGARVEVYSAHDYPDEKFGRGK